MVWAEVMSMSVDPIDPTDRRQERRWSLAIHLRLFDSDCNALLGHVIDIATKGIQVLSEDPIDTERNYNLAIEVITPDGDWQLVPLKAMSVWSRRAKSGLYYTGFHIFDGPTRGKQLLQLVESLNAFKEP